MFLGRILLINLISFMAISTSFADPIWICTVKADLVGETLFFWKKTRDAWMGQGKIDCQNYGQQWSIDVEVRFESFKDGSGAGSHSHIQIESGPLVASNPYQLTKRLIVRDRNPELKNPVWESESENPQWVLQVKGESQPGLLSSISHGTLEIYIPQFVPRGGF